ncbi:hypothetical protein MC885_013668, partial [Smutsia gigantea]
MQETITLEMVLELQIWAISCLGVFLLSKQDVYLGVSLQNQYLEANCFPSVFPIMIQQNMRFEKVFENVIDPGAVADILESFLTRFKLIQIVPPVLLKTVAGFPGIAPKIEFSTGTAIRKRVFLHRNRFIEERYKSQRPLSTSCGPKFPLNNVKMKLKESNLDRLPQGMQSQASPPYSTTRFFQDHPALMNLGNNLKISGESKALFVVRHVDSAKVFVSLENPHPVTVTKGNADFHQGSSFATFQHCRSPSPLLGQPFLQESFYPSSQSTWKKIHERVCRLLTSYRAQEHLNKEDSVSEVNYILDSPSYPLKKYP